MIYFILYLLGSFFCGSVLWALVFARLFCKKDIRLSGSGNPGASNVFRECGWKAGLLTLLFDMGKAAFPIWLLPRLFPEFSPVELIYADLGVGLCAWLGHVFSPFAGFRGGKGVATLIGIFAMLFPAGLLIALVLGLVVMSVFRWFSLGSLVGVTSLPVSYLFLVERPFASEHLPLFIFILLAVLLTWLRHSENILRILKGEESRLGRKK